MTHTLNNPVIDIVSQLLLMSALKDIDQLPYTELSVSDMDNLSDKYTFIETEELIDIQIQGIKVS